MSLSAWRSKYQKPKKYVNLHHHDEYSIRMALGRPDEIIDLLKANNITHYVVTNYGEVTGWVNQYFKCVDAGIIPILGVELYMNNYHLIQDGKQITEVEYCAHNETWKKPFEEVEQHHRDEIGSSYNIIMLAKNIDGYYNIIKCHNDAQINGFYEKPRVSDAFLQKNARGIVAISPMPYGDVFDHLINGRTDNALARVNFYKSVFEDFYVELVLSEDDNYVEYCKKIISFCLQNSIKMIVSNNSHYIGKEDKKTYEILSSMRQLRRNATKHNIDMADGMHYKTEEEIREIYNRKYKSLEFNNVIFNECISNIDNICNQISVLPIDTTPKMPRFPDAENQIRQKTYDGFKKLVPSQPKGYVDRIEYELGNIIRAGFADYFLFIEDVVKWALKNKNYTGAGRGSCCGSLVMYCLGITSVDPLKYNLIFERFLDAARLDEIINKGGEVKADSLPDVDLDFSDRDMVIKYLVDKYGESNICAIGSINRLKNKSVILDLARVFNIDLEEVYKVTKGDMALFGVDEEELSIEQLKKLSPSLNNLLNKYPDVETNFKKLRGSISYYGKHAGGVLVSNVSLTDLLPVRKTDGNIVSCWSEGIGDRELGRMGFVKMDILNVDTVTLIKDTVEMINERRGLEINMYSIPVDDKKALALCNKYDYKGVFQLESYVSVKVTRAMGGVKVFEDLFAINALMRPSALMNKFHEKFGNRRKGTEQWYIPECLKYCLAVTYGLPLYQESAYQVAKSLAGLSIVDAYKFMKLLYKGKMTSEKIPYWREKFMNGCKTKIDSKEVPEAYCTQIFDELLTFQGYGFNVSHAAAYSFLSSWQLYLKAHYFPEFICCLLRHTPRTKEKHGENLLESRVKYAMKNDVSVLLPDINRSGVDWVLEDDKVLRFGLKELYGVSSAAEEMVKYQPYRSVKEFLDKMPSSVVNKSRFETLLFAGCFDSFGDRCSIYNWYHNKYSKGKTEVDNQMDLGFDLDDTAEKEVFMTQKELDERQKKAIGFNFDFDFVDKYEKQMNAMKLRTIDDVMNSKVKFPVVICKAFEHGDFMTKQGRSGIKIRLTDGFEDANLYVSKDVFDLKKRYFDGSVIALPVVVGEDRQRFSLNSNEEIKKLEV